MSYFINVMKFLSTKKFVILHMNWENDTNWQLWMLAKELKANTPKESKWVGKKKVWNSI